MEFENILSLLIKFTSLIFLLVLALFGISLLCYYNPELFRQAPSQTASWSPPDPVTDIPHNKKGQLIKYGFLLVTESSSRMGPQAPESGLKYSGNNLACTNCHLEEGRKAGSAAWPGVANRFPQFRNRENRMGTIEDRINGCMQRSMNGHALPVESKQMEAMVAYIEWLGKDLPEEKEKEYKGFGILEIPEVAADPHLGKVIYERECTVCHGKNGEGVWEMDHSEGYKYPALWGKDTYNDGAGMYRIITAAEFIKSNMPFGQATVDNPKLTDAEAYNVAAYINSFDRPEKENKEADFPDRTLKPVSTPYGPWEDDFTPEQHKYGPFQPIMAFYKKKYGMKKSK